MAYPMDNFIDKKKLNELIKGCKTEEDLFGKDGILKQITNRI